MKGNAALAAVLALASAAFGQSEKDSPTAVAARTRQERLRTVTFVYRLKETSESSSVFNEGFRRGAEEKQPPNQRRQHESINRLVFDGDRIRHEDNHPTPDMRVLDWVDSVTVEVSDGTTVKKLHHPKSGATRQNAVAKISTPKTDSIADIRMHMPFHVCCRGWKNPACRNAFTLPPFLPTATTLKLGGRTLAEYANPDYAPARLWVDPAEGHSLRRVRYQSESGKAIGQTEIRSQLHEASGQWLPQSWTHTDYDGNGKVKREFEITVISVAVDATVSDSEFDIQFPPGLQVYDRRDGQWSLVRDDGTLQPVAGALVSSESVRPALQSNWWVRNWWWLVPLAICLLVVVVLCVRRVLTRQRFSTSAPTSEGAPPSDPTV